VTTPRDPWGIADELRTLRAELLAELPQIVERVLAAHDADRLLSTTDAARFFGKSRKAFDMWLRRGGAEVAQLAVTVGGRRMWRLADLHAYVERAGKVQ
jgi:hypothetical protein